MKSSDSDPPMTPTGRRVRIWTMVLLLGLVLAGTFWGQDDHFPVGPFRMYSVANRTDGQIRALAVEATTFSGESMALDFEKTGLRRAEVEGQTDRFLQDPGLLRHIATAYERLNEGADRLAEIRLIERISYLRDGKTYRTDERPLVSWSRP